MASTLDAPQGVRVVPRFTYEVTEGMTIAQAIAHADTVGGDWTILLYPGTYNEGDLTPNGGASITIKGMGRQRVEIVPGALPTIATIVSGHTLIIENIKITAFDATVPAVAVTGGLCRLSECQTAGVGAGDAITQIAGELRLGHGSILVGDVDLSSAACTLKMTGVDIHGTIDVAGAFAHDVEIRHSDFRTNNINLAGAIATFDIESCNDIGNITDASTVSVNCRISRCDITGIFSKTGTTAWVIDNCEILAITRNNAAGDIAVYGGIVLTVTSSAGIIRLTGTQYRAINRSATGNIVDQSSYLGDMPWHIQKWTWQAALANSQVAVRGTPIDGGSGQVLLEVTLNAGVGFREEAVEQLSEVGGARDNSLLPVRTPRMITQFIWDRSGDHQFVFFGLRETLGNAYPAAAEESAGFHWDTATGFVARSSTAAGDEDTVCTTPGHSAVYQLEIVIFGGVRVEFYINGVLVATHTTRVPTANLRWQHLLYTDGGGGATDVDVEILNGGCQQCPDSVPA